MKKIIIYNPAAESGGALTVLYEYYDKYRRQPDIDVYFITSIIELEEKKHIHVIKLPWVKKSWLHRIYCDRVYIRKLIKKIQPDELISLQNIGIPQCPVFQRVYVHNVIPFSDYKFNLLTEPKLWITQNIIGRLIYRSVKNADEVIVQTNWMKNKIKERCTIDSKDIRVERISLPEYQKQERTVPEKCTFFYPAGASSYKNHFVILNACVRLRKICNNNYRVVFTINEKNNALTRKIADTILNNKLPVDMVGPLSATQMVEMYKQSVLVFPSELETVGLPLIEAQAYNCAILVAEHEYSRDTVGNYENCDFFEGHDDELLAKLMKKKIDEFESLSDRSCVAQS